MDESFAEYPWTAAPMKILLQVIWSKLTTLFTQQTKGIDFGNLQWNSTNRHPWNRFLLLKVFSALPDGVRKKYFRVSGDVLSVSIKIVRLGNEAGMRHRCWRKILLNVWQRNNNQSILLKRIQTARFSLWFIGRANSHTNWRMSTILLALPSFRIKQTKSLDIESPNPLTLLHY